jgi:hypothetical protein
MHHGTKIEPNNVSQYIKNKSPQVLTLIKNEESDKPLVRCIDEKGYHIIKNIEDKVIAIIDMKEGMESYRNRIETSKKLFTPITFFVDLGAGSEVAIKAKPYQQFKTVKKSCCIKQNYNKDDYDLKHNVLNIVFEDEAFLGAFIKDRQTIKLVKKK